MKGVIKSFLEGFGGSLFGASIILIPIIIGGLVIHSLTGIAEETIQRYLIYICVVTGVLILIGFLITYFSNETNNKIKARGTIKEIGRWLYELGGILWIVFISSLIGLLIFLFL